FSMMRKVLFAPEASADAVAITMHELRACRPETILNDVRAARAMDLTEQAGGLDVPTLVLAGSRDRLTTPALAERLSALIRGARVSVAASEASVQRLMALQSFQRVEAPFAGIITARGIDRGALITSGSGSGANLLFRIAHVENLRIFVNVPPTFVRSIVPGQEVRVLVPEYPQRAFVAKIAST